jgi:hypothetical protein
MCRFSNFVLVYLAVGGPKNAVFATVIVEF